MKKITVKLHVKPDSKQQCLCRLDQCYKPFDLAGQEWCSGARVGHSHCPSSQVKRGGIRICGDFKVTLNPVLTAEQYPLPLIDDLFAGLSGAQKFSKIDLNQAYLHVCKCMLKSNKREMLTVNTHKILFRYCRLPFGITSAAAFFQRAMDQIFSDLLGVQCYLDDILCTGADHGEPLHNCMQLFWRNAG